jgi:O-antigen ligase
LRVWPGANLKLLAPLPSAGSVLALLALAVLLARGDWRLAGGIVIVALILFSSLAAPHYLGLFALLGFLGTAMPIVNQGGALNQYRWAILLVMALGLLLRNSMQASSARWHPMHFSLLLFVICAAVSSSYSVNGLMTLLKAGTFGCLILGVLLYGRLETRHESESSCKLLEHLYWCAGLVGLGCVLARVGVLPAGPTFFQGPFGNPNSLGAFIPFIAPVLLLKLAQSSEKAPAIRALNVALTIGFLVFLILSRSRGGIVATIVACGWWLYFSSRKVFAWFVVGVLLAVVILLAYFPAYSESLNRVYVQKGSTYVLQSRGKLLQASWDAAMESPVIGVGFGVAKGYSEDWQFGFESGKAGREKMNSLLAAVEEVGIVGSVFLVFPLAWVLVTAARRLLRIRRFHPSAGEFWTVLTLSACLLGGLANSLSEAWLTAAGFFSAIMFWLIFGVLAARLTIPFRVPR